MRDHLKGYAGRGDDHSLGDAMPWQDVQREPAVIGQLDGDAAAVVGVNNADTVGEARVVVEPVPRIAFEVVSQLEGTERGSGGFGSTGS